MINPFRYFKTLPEVKRLTMMMYVLFPLLLRNVEEPFHECGIDGSYAIAR
jgi:putative transposase